MSYFYNAFGKLISENNIENFASDEQNSVNEEITQFKVDLETGKLSKSQVQDRMNYFRKLITDGKLKDDDKKKLENIITTTVRTMDGINLVGNLELGGIIKAKGFHLHDGSTVKEIIRTKDKLAVPLDKNGNINLNPGKGKTINMTNLNIPKSGRITFGSGEDTDPYHLRKIGNKDSNHLRLTLNDNNNESLQIWGDSCKGDKCKPDGGTQKHAFYSNGDAHHKGEVLVHQNKHSTYNPTGLNTHFNHKGQSLNYIRGKTEMRGEVNYVDKSKGINIYNGKSSANPTGLPTHFNYRGQGLNYIRGKIEMRGEVNLVDNNKGINIYNKRNNNNPSGGGTHFNYKGQGLNYIRGKTEMRGEVNFIDKTKGVNIYNGKSGYNPQGYTTHFNHGGKGLNYIRGQTEIRGPQVNVISNNGIKVTSRGKTLTFGSLNSSWCHLMTNAPKFYMNKGLYVQGNIQAIKGLSVTGGRTHFQDAERKGRLRVGAAWGIPGLYSEDNQDIVIGCRSNRQVHLGRPNLVRIDQRGNLHLPGNANIYIGGRKVVKNGDPITLRSGRNGYRMQHSNWNAAARFSNRNRGKYERMYVETF